VSVPACDVSEMLQCNVPSGANAAPCDALRVQHVRKQPACCLTGSIVLMYMSMLWLTSCHTCSQENFYSQACGPYKESSVRSAH
jgi:hypothetical protein